MVFSPGITRINGIMFGGYKYLKSVTVPESVTYIGGYAFGECPNLRKAVIPRSLEKMIEEKNVFFKCTELEIQYV